jgi:CheY-like chemotaxis protein
MRPEVLEINSVVSEMQKMLRRLIGEDIELRVDLARDPGRIEADVSQLEQVIMNLAVNARDAMRDGGCLSIETKTATVDRDEAEAHPPIRPGRYVVMNVSDTGCGMDDETKSRAFDPFFTTKAQGQGTGLGLATVYGIVKQNKGFIWIESERDAGTTVSVYLPRTDKPLGSRQATTALEGARGGSETILVVEDDEMVRKLARRILERAGYDVLEAPNGGAALSLVESCGPRLDLLLTDVIMPDMNGRELAKKILALRPATKVMYTSGYSDDAIAHHGVLNPGVSLVEKPFSGAVLVSAVRDVLDGKAPGGSVDGCAETSF